MTVMAEDIIFANVVEPRAAALCKSVAQGYTKSTCRAQHRLTCARSSSVIAATYTATRKFPAVDICTQNPSLVLRSLVLAN